MSEGILSRRRKTKINYVENKVYNYIYNYKLVPPPNFGDSTPIVASAQLLSTTMYEAPTNAVNNTLYVTAVGGSGASNETSDGAAGEIVQQEISVEPGELISVNIGEEGTSGGNGGTTSFGTYLSAEGGLAADNVGNEETETGSGSGYVVIEYEIDDSNGGNEDE